MSLRTTILLVIGMSVSFSIILGVLVVSQHEPGRRGQKLPVLRAPTAAEIESSRRRAAERSNQDRGPNQQDGNEMGTDSSSRIAVAERGPEPWSTDRLELEKTESTRADFRVPSRHLDRVQADLLRQVEALKESRDSMLEELAEHLKKMTAAQAVEEIKVLDDETAAITLAKLSPKKREAVLRLLDAKRARNLGRLARNHAAKKSRG